MENFYEDTFDEDDNFENDQELDDIDAAEEEAALYSVVHHSEESFETPESASGINSDDYPHSSRSKASRWYQVSKIVSSNSPYENDKRPKTCAEYISLDTPNSQPLTFRRGAGRNRNRDFGRFNGVGKNRFHDSVKFFRGKTSHRQSHHVPSNDQHKTCAPNVPVNTPPETIHFSFLEEWKKLRAAKSSISMQSDGNPSDIPRFFENPLLWPEISNVQNTNVLSLPRIENNVNSAVAYNDPLLADQNKESTMNAEINDGSKTSNQESVSEVKDSVLQVHSDADSDIVEIKVPPKPTPPVIALDSGDEIDKVTVPIEDPDVIILDSDHEDLREVESAQPTLVNIMSVNPAKDVRTGSASLPQTTVQVEPRHKISQKKSKRKEPKKKTKRKKRSRDTGECNKAKIRMEKFYSESWGGEGFDHKEKIREMSDNPHHWKINEADRYGFFDLDPLARVRCKHCNEQGHMVKNCPRFRICCFMCGQNGHKESYCPVKKCLRCGEPSTMFSKGCFNCLRSPLRCNKCQQGDHFQLLCPTVWRKYHSVTTVEGAKDILPPAVYKTPKELACCVCAQRGHSSSGCPRRANVGTLDAFSNTYSHNQTPEAQFSGRRPMKRKHKVWRRDTNRQDWNDYHQKKRRTM